ncbi:hypothetical protein NDU88_004594 [Pleurodeles waltl]|uniref:Uncharacterized protein n=1 Tax=Pleurodeles waltl TaxID=8319 RepID=A0AAV7MEF9_PLEWA|nr:hypothetical protein NDU88_004594 [Pleurodeles waltl]
MRTCGECGLKKGFKYITRKKGISKECHYLGDADLSLEGGDMFRALQHDNAPIDIMKKLLHFWGLLDVTPVREEETQDIERRGKSGILFSISLE